MYETRATRASPVSHFRKFRVYSYFNAPFDNDYKLASSFKPHSTRIHYLAKRGSRITLSIWAIQKITERIQFLYFYLLS